jgi:predicted permease
METLLQDLKFGMKLLLKEKGFTVTALFTLALAIGANSAIFTVVNAVLVQPLPFPDSGRLVTIYNSYPGVGIEKASNSAPDYGDRRQMTDVFEQVALFGTSGYDTGTDGMPERIPGMYTTPELFPMLRVRPLLGRTFTQDEAVPGKDKVVVLSYGLWKEKFAGDRGIFGKTVRLSGVPYRIVGVVPEGFEFLSREVRLWVPFALTDAQKSDDARHSNSWGMVARLKPGVSLAQAQGRIDALNKSLLDRFPQFRKLLENARYNTRVRFLQDERVDDIRNTLYMLQAAVLLVLLIGCVNVANLMLVRANVRLKEIAIRFSLGAGRVRLARQLLTESVLLAVAGGALGIVVAFWGVRLLNYLGAEELPSAVPIRIDAFVLGYTLLIAVLAGVFFGLVPLVHLLRRDLNAAFRQTERTGTAERPALFTRNILAVCQVSIAFVLLIGAGLMTLSFQRVLSVDPGFRPEGAAAARISLPPSRYQGDAQLRSFYSRLLEDLRGAPGIQAASITSLLPFGGSSNASVITVVGYAPAPGENPPVPAFNVVGPDYFRAAGIPLLQGRALTGSDSENSQRVVVIDEFLAHRYWPNRSPLGAKIRRGIENDSSAQTFTVVGVVRAVKTSDLADQKPNGQVYYSYQQAPPRNVHIVFRTAGAAAPAVNAVRSAVMKIDSELPLYDVKTMPERLARSVMDRRAAMTLCLVFAGVALILAAVGIYGVLAYAVAQRRREFGIRIALGAQAQHVLGMVFWHGLKLAAAGLAVGIGGAYFFTRVLASLLFGVRPANLPVYAFTATVLALSAIVASLVPSLRAIRIKPSITLRNE